MSVFQDPFIATTPAKDDPASSQSEVFRITDEAPGQFFCF